MQVAQVIVDVKTMQTDKPYSYLIPDQMVNILERGMRVAVPFGKGNRLTQGFVVDFAEVDDTNRLKEIAQMEDIVPVLNSELLELADYMKDANFAFKINCLQTMLPTALKTKYQKYIKIQDTSLLNDDRAEILYDTAVENYGLSTIKNWILKDQAQIIYRESKKQR